MYIHAPTIPFLLPRVEYASLDSVRHYYINNDIPLNLPCLQFSGYIFYLSILYIIFSDPATFVALLTVDLY